MSWRTFGYATGGSGIEAGIHAIWILGKPLIISLTLPAVYDWRLRVKAGKHLALWCALAGRGSGEGRRANGGIRCPASTPLVLAVMVADNLMSASHGGNLLRPDLTTKNT
jgi:hypothetical protein